MSEYAQYYEAFNLGRWARENAEECLCRGRGWALSDVDTWHHCPIHFTGQTHPEEADYIADCQSWERMHPEEAAQIKADAEAQRLRREAEADEWSKRFGVHEEDIPF